MLATLTAVAVAASSSAGWAAVVQGALENVVETSTWVPPSPDPSGIAYIPSSNSFILSDGEVDEMPLYAGANLFRSSPDGELLGEGTTLPWSNEPTGVGYNPENGHLFVSDDDKKSIFEIASAGSDEMFGAGSDGAITSFKTSAFGNTDPEDVSYDTARDELLTIDGVGAKFFRIQAGPNGRFDGVYPSGDDIAAEFDLAALGAVDPEGIAYDDARDTVVVMDGDSKMILELAENGSLLNTIDVESVGMPNPAGIAVGAASDGSGQRNYYVVDRGLDNNSHPEENDGRVYEISASLPSITNRPPAANAGPDILMDLPETAQLVGSGSDDGLPEPLSFSWSKLSGPGTVAFGSASSETTSATFSATGTYVIRLTVDDGQLQDVDDVVVSVYEPGAPRTTTVPVAMGSDDAMEGGGTSGTFVDLASADVELGANHNGVPMLNGLRFADLPVPQGGEIVSARIQFKVDETGTGAASYTIAGEAADNAPTYVSVKGNISSRTRTTHSVSWTPPDWTLIGESGPGQLTPDLKTVLQEIVDRPGWQQGNAAAFMIDGTGRRTAEAKDGLTPPVLVLEFKTVPAANTPPVVNAGLDSTVRLPGTATLDGNVEDDGKPNPPAALTTTWSMVSGPGTVSFADAAAVDTTASFSAAGSYTLRLTADDGAVTAQDEVVVTVEPADVPNQAPVVLAGDDSTVAISAGATLDGTVSDDGKPAPFTTSWSMVSGPGTVTFADAAAVDTTAAFSVPGTYVLRLTASDGELTGQDDLTLTVQSSETTGGGGGGGTPTNVAPTVNAGADATVRLPGSAALDGTVSDDGLPAAFTTAWSKVSGPGMVTFGDATQVDTTASFSVAGVYTLRLQADDTATTGQDDVVVTVKEAVTTPTLTAKLTYPSVLVGTSTSVVGSISPAVKGQQLRLQRWNGSAWRTVQDTSLPAGSKVGYRFVVVPLRSGISRYRVVSPAGPGRARVVAPGSDKALAVRAYQASITRVSPAREVVVVKNTGTVAFSLAGWRLIERRSGERVRLPHYTVRPGQVVRIHTGRGATDGDDLYLGSEEMWAAHGVAVLRDARLRVADRLSY